MGSKGMTRKPVGVTGPYRKSTTSMSLTSPKVLPHEWVGLSDKQKLILIKHAPNWTVLDLIEEVEQMLKEKNGG